MQLNMTVLPSCCAPLPGVTLNPVMLYGSTCGPLNGTLFSGNCQELVPSPNWNVYVCGPGASVVVVVYSSSLPTFLVNDIGIELVPSMTTFLVAGVVAFWYMTAKVKVVPGPPEGGLTVPAWELPTAALPTLGTESTV